MEAVVSTAVFAVAVTGIIGTYLMVLKVDAKTRAERSVQENGRFIMEFLGKELRTGHLDYASYFGGLVGANPETTLHIVNQNNEAEDVICGNPNMTLTKSGYTTSLNSSAVTVTKCSFYIAPPIDPFRQLLLNPPNNQPFVTVVLELTSNFGQKEGETAVINLESTYSLREYPSRE